MSGTPRLVPVRDTQGQIAGFRREDELEPPAPAAPAAEPATAEPPSSSTSTEAQAPARRRVVELLLASAQAGAD